MTRLLVSVRDVDEALAAASAGADFIDLKDPSAGALGGLAPACIGAIVGALRVAHPALPVSATIGDLPAHERKRVLDRVVQVAGCGVDYVKVGIGAGPGARELLHELACCGSPVVPVLLADEGIDFALVREVLQGIDVRIPSKAFPAVMLDTAHKRGGSLLQRIATESLARFIAEVQGTGRLAGLAGALRADDVPRLLRLAPDFAGFRSAVCAGPRAAALDPARVSELHVRLAAHTRPTADLLVRG